MASDTEAGYKLSTELLGHSGDVRAVCSLSCNGVDYMVTASRDRTAVVWRRDGDRDFVLHKTLSQHTGYVSSLVSFADDNEGLKKGARWKSPRDIYVAIINYSNFKNNYQ